MLQKELIFNNSMHINAKEFLSKVALI